MVGERERETDRVSQREIERKSCQRETERERKGKSERGRERE